MINRLTNSIQYSLASKRYMRQERQPNHQPTTELWKTGDGRIQKKQILVSGWNVNGFRSVIRKNQLVPFWQGFKPDFLCLNETKVDYYAYKKEIENKHLFEGYHQYWNFCKISSGYSGVLILTPHKPISIVEDLPNSNSHSLQGRMLTLQYQSFFLVNIYKPNAGIQLQRLNYRTQHYDASFNAYMAHLLSKKQVLIFGDMNVAHNEIDLANPKSNRGRAGFTDEERASFQNLLALGFTDTFRCLYPKEQKFTYWSYQKHAREKNIGWRIDYILTSPQLKIIDATIHDQVRGSDHCPISALIQIN